MKGFTFNAQSQILSRAAQARGHVKTVAKPLVEMHYSLNSTNGNRKNRDNVEDLCQRIGYAYKVCDFFCYLTAQCLLFIIIMIHASDQDPDERTGLYRHPIIQAIIDKAWFRNKTDDGVFLPEFVSASGGIPVAAIALVLTVVSLTYTPDHLS